jgi:ribosome-binding protein aMBF1 (putative translation factor)
MIDPAPFLTKEGRCSECGVKPLILANSELLVCPRCYAVLWHRDYTAELKRKRLAAEAAAREQAAEAKAKREQEKQERLQRRQELGLLNQKEPDEPPVS